MFFNNNRGYISLNIALEHRFPKNQFHLSLRFTRTILSEFNGVFTEYVKREIILKLNE